MSPVPIVRWQLGNSGFQPMYHARLAARLSEGHMSAPAVAPAALSALQKAISQLIDGLSRELDAVGEELQLVSAAAIRVDPEAAKEISFIGSLPPQEIRSALTVPARGLGDMARRILTGSLAPYLTPDQAQALQGLKTQSDQLVAAILNLDMVPVAPEHQDLVQKYVDLHLGSLTSLLQASEKGVVEAEAGSVPVLEPAEKGLSPTAIAAGIGVVGVGVLLWALLS